MTSNSKLKLKKPLRFVQHAPRTRSKSSSSDQEQQINKREDKVQPTLLFVHRDSTSVQQAQSSDEAQAISEHIALLNQKLRRKQKQIAIHPSVSRIVAENRRHEEDRKKDFLSLYEVASEHEFPSGPPRISASAMPGESTLDPFTPLNTMTDPELKNLLYLYFKFIYPFAKFLHSDWEWVDSLPQIQATPALSNAIAAFSSLFFSGLRYGSRGVVLPSPNDGSQPHLWPIPEWFRYHTRCLSDLTKAMNVGTEKASISTYHTVLFLLRIAILHGDGTTARMHLSALKTISRTLEKDVKTLALESTVIKSNIISAYFHRPGIFTSDQEDEFGILTPREVQNNHEYWTDEVEWIKFRNNNFGRLLVWHSDVPDSSFDKNVRARILGMDLYACQLSEAVLSALSECYQLSLYLWTYLTGISFEPSTPKIRSHLVKLQQGLMELGLSETRVYAPTTVFNLLFAGAIASRGSIERLWFVDQMVHGNVQVRYMHEIYEIISKFADPEQCARFLLEEILMEILAVRGTIGASAQKSSLYFGDPGVLPLGPRPITYMPDLSVPITHIHAATKKDDTSGRRSHSEATVCTSGVS